MTVLSLREKVYKKLESVDDRLLLDVLNFIEFETDEGPFVLSDAQKNAVDEAREQIRNGNSFANEEVDKEIDSWLNQ